MSEKASLVLASASPARARLFSVCALHFSVVSADLDEGGILDSLAQQSTSPTDTARYLAEMKAQRVSIAHPSSFVVGADQILFCEGRILRKSRSLSSLRETLLFLKGKEHTLYSAAAVVCEGKLFWSHCASARVWLRDFGEPFLDFYLARFGNECLSSVGGYRVEQEGPLLIARIAGDPYVVQGLPILELLAFLRELPHSDSFFSS